MKQCPCGSQVYYSKCCELYLIGEQVPSSPEALMRSRYAAYSIADIDYIKKTMQGKPLNGFDEVEARSWAESVTWLGLKVINTTIETPSLGYVEFIARYMEGDKIKFIHEISEFHFQAGRWFYVDGRYSNTTKSHNNQKISRNSLCPCASQKKFKNCHGKPSSTA